MKKFIFPFAFALITLHASPKFLTFDDVPRIVSATELSFDKIQELIQSKNPDFIIEFRENTVMPIQLLLQNRVFSAIVNPNLTFKVDKTCYLRIVNKKCYLSEDLVHWQKAERFFEGQSMLQLTPNADRSGLVLETTVVPYGENEELG